MATPDFSHLTNEAEKYVEENTDRLDRISGLALQLKDRKEQAESITEQLKAVKKEITNLEQVLIPENMLAATMTEFKLSSGEKVAIKEELSASVKDYTKLHKFLKDRGDESLLKNTIEIGKVHKKVLSEILKYLNETHGITASNKLFIAPATLKKYFKDLCGIGSEEASEMPLAKVDSTMVSTFTYYKTTVK